VALLQVPIFFFEQMIRLIYLPNDFGIA